jgi:hypothetical protein
MSDTTLEKANTDLKALQQLSFETTKIANPETLQDYINIGKVMAGSGMWDIKNAQQATALMILGSYYGLSAVQSLTGIHIVQNKPMLHYSVILAKVRQHPDYDYRILERSEKLAKIVFYRHGEECGISEFDIAKATKRKTQNLDKMPEVMLMARAVGDGVRIYCPDVLNGMPVYAQGEIQEDPSAELGLDRHASLRAELSAKIANENPDKAQSIVAEATDVTVVEGGDQASLGLE